MASQAPQLPLMYTQLELLSTQVHANYKIRSVDAAPHLAKIHAIPILLDEFVAAQRFYPIVFSLGDNPIPLALMGLNEGVNTFVDDEGKLLGPTYIPAYVRRYPFMLAQATVGGDTLSLCFDPSSGMVGDFEDGQPLFDGEQPSETTQSIMKFCEEFEVSAQRTNQFMEELKKLDILMDGELSVQLGNDTPPSIYRGFRMVDEEKFREMRGDELRRINQNGILPLLMAHLFSLPLSRDIFMRQIEQGKVPQPVPNKAPAPAEA
jgi:hypothetical protein